MSKLSVTNGNSPVGLSVNTVVLINIDKGFKKTTHLIY